MPCLGLERRDDAVRDNKEDAESAYEKYVGLVTVADTQANEVWM